MNIMITMILGGLWHGANWTFVFWGGLNGLALCCEKLFLKHEHKNNIIITLGRIIAVFSFISFTWIFFRAENFAASWKVIRGIITLQDGIVQPFFWSFFALVILILSELAAFFRSKRKTLPEIIGYCPVLNLNRISGLTAFFVFVGIILGLAFTGEHPFVYFQF